MPNDTLPTSRLLSDAERLGVLEIAMMESGLPFALVSKVTNGEPNPFTEPQPDTQQHQRKRVTFVLPSGAEPMGRLVTALQNSILWATDALKVQRSLERIAKSSSPRPSLSIDYMDKGGNSTFLSLVFVSPADHEQLLDKADKGSIPVVQLQDVQDLQSSGTVRNQSLTL